MSTRDLTDCIKSLSTTRRQALHDLGCVLKNEQTNKSGRKLLNSTRRIASGKKTLKDFKAHQRGKSSRTPSTWQNFMTQKREQAKKELRKEQGLSPTDKIPLGDISTKLGNMWKKLSAEEKAEYKTKIEYLEKGQQIQDDMFDNFYALLSSPGDPRYQKLNETVPHTIQKLIERYATQEANFSDQDAHKLRNWIKKNVNLHMDELEDKRNQMKKILNIIGTGKNRKLLDAKGEKLLKKHLSKLVQKDLDYLYTIARAPDLRELDMEF